MQNDPELQSQDTLNRLRNHSKQEKYWLDAYQELEAAHNFNITLYDALKKLATDLKEGAIYGEGDEALAGTTAFIGVSSFMRIFNSLTPTQQETLENLNNGDKDTFREILQNLTKGGEERDTSTCVNEISNKISNILYANSHNEFLATKPTLKVEDAEKIFSEFKLKLHEEAASGSE